MLRFFLGMQRIHHWGLALARINIEECFWLDGRLRLLQKKIGEDPALGQILRLWRLSQECHKEGHLISEDQFKIHEFSEALIESGFAERRANGIYAKGSQKHFDWLIGRKEAGKAGAKKTNEKRWGKKREPNDSEHLVSANGRQTSPSYSYSTSYSKKETTLSTGVDLHPLATLWNQHCSSLPKVKEMNSKRIGLCKQSWKKSQDPEYWRRIITAISGDKFCSGDNDRGWVATFDYFLRPDVQTRALEGAFGKKIKHGTEPIDIGKIMRGET